MAAITDKMIDFVFPKNNEKEFIRIAEKLGISELVFVYDKPTDVSSFQQDTKIKLSSAVICKPDDVRKYKGRFLTLVEAPEDQADIRNILERNKPDIMFNLEFGRRKDFIHHRASGLNHVLAEIASQKGVAIGFNFSKILSAKPQDRAVYMGRMMQNIDFAKKFKFKTTIASFARSPWEMRGERELKSFFNIFGSIKEEVEKGF